MTGARHATCWDPQSGRAAAPAALLANNPRLRWCNPAFACSCFRSYLQGRWRNRSMSRTYSSQLGCSAGACLAVWRPSDLTRSATSHSTPLGLSGGLPGVQGRQQRRSAARPSGGRRRLVTSCTGKLALVMLKVCERHPFNSLVHCMRSLPWDLRPGPLLRSLPCSAHSPSPCRGRRRRRVCPPTWPSAWPSRRHWSV